MISLNVVNALIFCPIRKAEGQQDFLISITRDGVIGAYETYGLYQETLKPDAIIGSYANPLDLFLKNSCIISA